ncbi:unnamed protein product [Sphagnum balticum]
MHTLPSSTAECAQLTKRVQLDAPTSTWLSVTAKGVRLQDYINFDHELPSTALGVQPVCPPVSTPGAYTMDHLPMNAAALAAYKPEYGLADAFEHLAGTARTREPLEQMAARVADAMRASQTDAEKSSGQDGGVHWTLSTVAALYWRVKGDAPQAIGVS